MQARTLLALRLLGYTVTGLALVLAFTQAVGGGDRAGVLAGLGAVAGLGLAAHARDGRYGFVASLATMAAVPLLVEDWHAAALALTLIAAASVGVLAWAMQRMAFDWRLERGRDQALLLLAVCAHAALLSLALMTFDATLDAVFDGLGMDPVSGWAAGVLGPQVYLPLAASCGLLTAMPMLGPLTQLRRLTWNRRLWLLPLLALLLACTLLAPWQEMQGQGRSLWWLAPPAVVLALVVACGSSTAAMATLAAGVVLGLNTRSAGSDIQVQSLALVVAMLATLQIAHALRASAAWREQRWEWALDGSRLGVADWRLHQNDSFVSSVWRALTGFDGEDWTPDAWLAAVHPEDSGELRNVLDEVASGRTGRLRLELRLPRAPGGEGWRWLEATLLVIERGPGGAPVRLLATLLDVDERHEALERQRLSVSLFQHLHEGLLVTDAELRVLDANPAYTEILGVARNEMLGSVPSLLRPAPADPLARQQRAAMWASLRDTGGWRGELLERHRGGQICALQVTISSVLGPLGDLRYHVLVITDVTQQRAQRERLERQAHFDELTRLPNRARLSQLLDEAMRSADRDGYLLTVCYLDLDRFKPVNDRFGHEAGDRLLVELSARLRSALRTRDTWADTAARLGGDEFVLLLRAETIEEARMAVERVLRVVAQPYAVGPSDEQVQITASMGATVYPIDRSDADTLLRHADHAMYGAKQSGRNGYLFFDPELRRRTEERALAIGRVQEALDQGEFILYYQPKVDMRSGRVLGFEALLRWEHPQHGLIAPMQFLPLIENTGLSARVGDWVFSQALEHLSQWRRSGLDFSVSVNVSARHLQEPDFAQRLSELLARHEEPLAAHFELEALETAAHADIEATSALMARCRSLGVRFALDDFGTGYSTLTYLKQLPVDVLKIDRSFVHHMLDDSQDRALVEGVIGLARTFGCTVIAEGVESPAQARALMDMGCDVGQGTGIAAPMPASQVAGWVRHYRGMFALTTMPSLAAAAAGEAGGAEIG
jgi:diguanylate cyclase (GGDEF)-like protein/PAS domain S-box-containing protein